VFSDLYILFKIALPLIYLIPTESHVLIFIRFIFSIMLMVYINRTISISRCITLLMAGFVSIDTLNLLKLHYSSSLNLILGDNQPLDLTENIPTDPFRQSVVDATNRALREVSQRPAHEIASLAEEALSKMGKRALTEGHHGTTNHQGIYTFEQYTAAKIICDNSPPLEKRFYPEKYGALTSGGIVTVGGRNTIQIYGSLRNSSAFYYRFQDNIADYKQRNGIV
jgi:hypothetical protein